MFSTNSVPDVTFDNYLSVKSSKASTNLSSAYSFIETNRKTLGMRPQTAVSSTSKSKFSFEKPSVRCSGPY